MEADMRLALLVMTWGLTWGLTYDICEADRSMEADSVHKLTRG